MKERHKLPPIPLRKEDDPNYQPHIWQPSWKCFCCEDTGIAKNAARMFIEGYQDGKHKFPVCQNPDCQEGKKFGQVPDLQLSLDWRLEAWMCLEADAATRQMWREWAKLRQQKRQKLKIDLSTIGKNLRGRSRTSEEEMEAIQKHQAVIAEMNGHCKEEDSASVEQS